MLLLIQNKTVSVIDHLHVLNVVRHFFTSIITDLSTTDCFIDCSFHYIKTEKLELPIVGV